METSKENTKKSEVEHVEQKDAFRFKIIESKSLTQRFHSNSKNQKLSIASLNDRNYYLNNILMLAKNANW